MFFWELTDDWVICLQKLWLTIYIICVRLRLKFKNAFNGNYESLLVRNINLSVIKTHAMRWGLAPDPAWHTTSAESGSHQPRLLMDWDRHYQAAGHSQWGAIRERSVGLFLVGMMQRITVPSQKVPCTNSLIAPFAPFTLRCHTYIHTTGKMPVYRAPRIFSPIHRDTATSMAQGPPASLPTRLFLAKPREGLRQGPSPRGGMLRC